MIKTLAAIFTGIILLSGCSANTSEADSGKLNEEQKNVKKEVDAAPINDVTFEIEDVGTVNTDNFPRAKSIMRSIKEGSRIKQAEKISEDITDLSIEAIDGIRENYSDIENVELAEQSLSTHKEALKGVRLSQEKLFDYVNKTVLEKEDISKEEFNSMYKKVVLIEQLANI